MKSQGLKDPYEGIHVLLDIWKKNKKPLYQNMCDIYTEHVDYIGRYENLKTDLLEILSISGDLTNEVEDKIIELPRLNYTHLTDYKDIYDENTRKIIQLLCQEMIDKYNYKF